MTGLGVRGQQIAVQVSAERSGAATLVWAHGLGASRAIDDVAGRVDHALLAEARRVVRYDAVGHGESSTTDAAQRYAWSQLARDQLVVTRALGVGRFVSVGESMGAATAIEVARLAPERVDGLILITPPAVWESRPPIAASYQVTPNAGPSARPQPPPPSS